jgi:hypothetical protein
METAIDILKQAEGTVFVDRRGKRRPLNLYPPLANSELQELEAKCGFTYPSELRDLLLYSRGFEVLDPDSPVDSPVDFSSETPFAFRMDEVFPHGMPIVCDHSGNHWVIDLLGDTSEDTTVFYGCHDPPVIVYQARSIGMFIREMLRLGNNPWRSDISEVHDEHVYKIWEHNRGTLTHADSLNGDADLRAFAESLDHTYQFVDLRQAFVGDGFSWGRYGAETVCKRFGTKRIFAYQTRKLNWFQRIIGV